MAQAVHSAFEFQDAYPDETALWRQSNYLVIVSVPNMHELMKLGSEASHRGIKFTLTVEPDLYDELTAITFEATPESQKLCATLPLALKVPSG